MKDWSGVFGDVFAKPASPVQAGIFAQVMGEDYPAEVAPYSYTTRSELARIAAEVRVGPGGLLVDVGGGRGGPGLWVAAQTGADYLDIDIAPSALERVYERAQALGLGDRASTRIGGFETMPMADGEASAVMSIDALVFATDKPLAVRELARVLSPGGRLVLTTWDYHRQPVGRPPQVPDHRPLLELAGLRLVAYDETPDWRDRQLRIGELMMADAQALAEEAGTDLEEMRAGLAEMQETIHAMLRRVLIVAERR